MRYIVFDKYANIVAQHQLEFPQYYPNPGYVADLFVFEGRNHSVIRSFASDGTNMMQRRFNFTQVDVSRRAQNLLKQPGGQGRASRSLVRISHASPHYWFMFLDGQASRTSEKQPLLGAERQAGHSAELSYGTTRAPRTRSLILRRNLTTWAFKFPLECGRRARKVWIFCGICKVAPMR